MAGSAAFKLLIEMEVATSYYFVGGNSIQAGAVGDSKANFFSNVKDGNFVASPSIHVHLFLDFLVDRPIYSMSKVSSHCNLSVTSLGFLYTYMIMYCRM